MLFAFFQIQLFTCIFKFWMKNRICWKQIVKCHHLNWNNFHFFFNCMKNIYCMIASLTKIWIICRPNCPQSQTLKDEKEGEGPVGGERPPHRVTVWPREIKLLCTCWGVSSILLYIVSDIRYIYRIIILLISCRSPISTRVPTLF